MGVPSAISKSLFSFLILSCGQTFMHSSHLVHKAMNSSSRTAPGGLMYRLDFRIGILS